MVLFSADEVAISTAIFYLSPLLIFPTSFSSLIIPLNSLTHFPLNPQCITKTFQSCLNLICYVSQISQGHRFQGEYFPYSRVKPGHLARHSCTSITRTRWLSLFNINCIIIDGITKQ